MKYLVTGATGNLGGLTVDALLKTIPAKQVSVLARDPAKAAALGARGVAVTLGADVCLVATRQDPPAIDLMLARRAWNASVLLQDEISR